ncbi:MAG: 2'-5' RNA ligase family protein [Clostridium sp.]
MIYALELLFNEEGHLYVKELLSKLNMANIITLENNVDELCPHITLGIFNNLDKDEEAFLKKLKKFRDGYSPIKLSFEGIGTFPQSGTLLLKPTVTEELLILHKNFYENFKEFVPYSNAYYLPNKWSPHCTLVTGVSTDKLKEVFNFVIDLFIPLEVELVDVALFKADFIDGKILNSKRIF